MAIEYTPQDSSPPVTAIDYDPQNTSGLVSDPAEGGSFSASNEAELAGAQSFAAKAKEAQNAAEQSETNASTSETNAATSAANALASETNAATSAANALTSEINAANSASNALASATAAQNLEVTSASFDTADGTLTLTKSNSDTVTTDLDGRYLTTHQDITGKADLSGATFTGDVLFNDGVKAKFGTDSDLLIYHNDGEPSVIEDAGELGLVLKTNGNIFAVTSDTNESMITATPDGGVTLYHDNNIKLLVGQNAVTIDENLSVSSGNDLNVLGGELTVTGSAEAELFKGDLEGAVHFKGAVASGATLTKGDVVYVSGYSGGKTEVDLADASDSSKMPAFGIVAADPVGVNVDVVTFGTLKSIDTSTYTDGDELYVDTTAGGLTATAPSGEGNLVQKIAKVVRASNSGNIKVMGAGRTNATPNLNDGNIFIGDSNNLATTASFATEVTNATTGKADLSGADFTGDVTTTGDLGINTTNPAHPLDVKGNVNVTYGTDPIYTTSPLLTNASSTTYSIAEITDIYYASQLAGVNAAPVGSWGNARRAVQILFNFNGDGHPTNGGWSAADPLVVSTFINNTYSSNDISTFQSSASAIFNGTYTLQTTIIDDILDGDYDHLVDYKVGINVDPATEALDVGGNIKASGTLATGGYTLASTDGTNGQALVTDGSGNVSFGDVTVDVSGKANLSGADFTGDVSVAGTFNTDGIEVTLNSVDYKVLNTDFFAPIFPVMRLGGTSLGNKVHTIEMRPAAGGVRMHWHESGLYGGSPPPSGQTLRFHTTDRGIHVGDDLVGTYTAGDSQNNADTDFGMLVGRNSTNIGSNNFGFGYNINFNSASISSCAGIGSSIYINPTTNNSIGIGGDVFVGTTGTETPAQEGIFAGGNVVSGRGNYSFSWGKGDYEGATRYAAVNLGKGCVMFGQQINIDADSTWSLVGGTINESSYLGTYAENAHYSIAWGRSVRLDDSNGAVTFGDNNLTTDGHHSAAIGANHNIYAQGAFLGGVSNTAYVNAPYATAFGYGNGCEGEASFAVGKNNDSLGDSGACIGQGLKTPLFLTNGNYVWNNHSVVVGGYNDEAHKYYTNTNNTAWVTDHRFVVGTGKIETVNNEEVITKDTGFVVAVPDSGFSGIIMPHLAESRSNYTSASAAKAGGVPVGGLYRIGSDVKILLSTD